jgi:hypothetical protein
MVVLLLVLVRAVVVVVVMVVVVMVVVVVVVVDIGCSTVFLGRPWFCIFINKQQYRHHYQKHCFEKPLNTL